MNDMFYKIEYCLKYKDDIVFKFNIKNKRNMTVKSYSFNVLCLIANC